MMGTGGLYRGVFPWRLPVNTHVNPIYANQYESLNLPTYLVSLVINRLSLSASSSYTSRRILLISSTLDSPASYIPIMNCIFSAQKMGVPIDIARLFAAKTSFLAHASVSNAVHALFSFIQN
jgi:hypothetical protein